MRNSVGSPNICQCYQDMLFLFGPCQGAFRWSLKMLFRGRLFNPWLLSNPRIKNNQSWLQSNSSRSNPGIITFQGSTGCQCFLLNHCTIWDSLPPQISEIANTKRFCISWPAMDGIGVVIPWKIPRSTYSSEMHGMRSTISSSCKTGLTHSPGWNLIPVRPTQWIHIFQRFSR